MQIKKEDIEHKIAKEAKKIFLKKGYSQTSMREIATASNVGLSNIYNYYTNKDELFCSIVEPAITEFRRILESYNNPEKIDMSQLWLPELTEKAADDYNLIMVKYRDLLSLLLFKSGGSSLAKFKENFTNEATDIMVGYMKNMKKKYPSLKWDFSPFFIHINAVQMFTLLEEIIMHKIKEDEAKQIFTEYINYHNNGWKDLIYSNNTNE